MSKRSLKVEIRLIKKSIRIYFGNVIFYRQAQILNDLNIEFAIRLYGVTQSQISHMEKKSNFGFLNHLCHIYRKYNILY